LNRISFKMYHGSEILRVVMVLSLLSDKLTIWKAARGHVRESLVPRAINKAVTKADMTCFSMTWCLISTTMFLYTRVQVLNTRST
jgi:hypothetical protein